MRTFLPKKIWETNIGNVYIPPSSLLDEIFRKEWNQVWNIYLDIQQQVPPIVKVI